MLWPLRSNESSLPIIYGSATLAVRAVVGSDRPVRGGYSPAGRPLGKVPGRRQRPLYLLAWAWMIIEAGGAMPGVIRAGLPGSVTINLVGRVVDVAGQRGLGPGGEQS